MEDKDKGLLIDDEDKESDERSDDDSDAGGEDKKTKTTTVTRSRKTRRRTTTPSDPPLGDIVMLIFGCNVCQWPIPLSSAFANYDIVLLRAWRDFFSVLLGSSQNLASPRHLLAALAMITRTRIGAAATGSYRHCHGLPGGLQSFPYFKADYLPRRREQF
ncbi:hypothetical protein THAOC_15267 [Thalassiosira oceanica]|uniref:Uncharacterized protein n=1 Tax=Thalassiosira oceanica TaxID=159749 RepID=K0SF84_THAOC|nr:hypothetical protein THAOC_15267 [Thalassiosira oceanica]|eukprot:EJK64040.1 hypothetical protein THAOC_15267 [Thalassiosira oceanica]